VLTPFPGATPERVEALGTEPIEDALRQLPEADIISSSSQARLSVVRVELKDSVVETKPVWSEARDLIADVQVELPGGALRGPHRQLAGGRSQARRPGCSICHCSHRGSGLLYTRGIIRGRWRLAGAALRWLRDFRRCGLTFGRTVTGRVSGAASLSTLPWLATSDASAGGTSRTSVARHFCCIHLRADAAYRLAG